jgi:hypothetical protein
LHDTGERDVANLDSQVNMVCHQTKGENTVAVPFDTFLDEKEKPATVFGVKENVLTAIAAKDDMVQRTGIVKAGFTGHEKSITSKSDIPRSQA